MPVSCHFQGSKALAHRSAALYQVPCICLFAFAFNNLCIILNLLILSATYLYLPRDAMRKRGICCSPRCLSVRLSLRPSRSCIVPRRLRISSLLPGSHIILVFDPARRYPIPKGAPSSGALNTQR